MTKYSFEEKHIIARAYKLHTNIIDSVISHLSIDIDPAEIEEIYKKTTPNSDTIIKIFTEPTKIIKIIKKKKYSKIKNKDTKNPDKNNLNSDRIIKEKIISVINWRDNGMEYLLDECTQLVYDKHSNEILGKRILDDCEKYILDYDYIK